jgi:CheY-like chemotaxis protein
VKKTLSGGGRILLMDDEEIVRVAAVKMLEHLGYETASTETGEEAVALFRQAADGGRPFDAVILDLTVRGGMGGRDANRLLHEIDPGVRTIVFSGYSEDPIMSDYRKYGFSGFLSKPCEIGELSVVLHEVLKKGTENSS